MQAGKPRSWPIGADAAHVAARSELAEAERELRDRIERVAQLRRRLPPGPLLADYRLQRTDPPGEVRLRDLFGDHRTLVVYHLMFDPAADQACPMCSMWVDGFHGVRAHLAQHTAFAVVAKAPAAKLLAWGRRRGWTGLPLLSSFGTTFNHDLAAETPDGAQRPVISVLTTEGDGVRHRYSAAASFPDGSERGIDLLNPVWNLLDLLPQGRGDWYAGNDYPTG